MKNLNAYPLTQALIYDEIQRGKSNAVTSSIERNFFALFRPTILAFRGRLVQRHEGADLEIVWSSSTPFFGWKYFVQAMLSHYGGEQELAFNKLLTLKEL